MNLSYTELLDVGYDKLSSLILHTNAVNLSRKILLNAHWQVQNELVRAVAVHGIRQLECAVSA